MTARASLLAHRDEPVQRPGHRAAHEQQVPLGVHPHHPAAAPSRPARFTCRASALCVRFGFFAPKPSWSWAFPAPPVTCTTGHGPASITVTGTWAPSASNTRVMPSFLPISPLMSLLDLDLHVHAGRHIELRQRVHRLGARIENVDQPLVGLQLELLAALLVDVRAAEHRPQLPLGRQRDGPRDLRAGLLGRAHDVGRGLVDQRVVEGLEANPDLASHARLYFRILVTTPAPTVRPPSRIANRSCSSIAIGVISSIPIFALSPGLTISPPAGNSTVPVTSVVRK